MNSFLNYQIVEEIYQSQTTAVYRGYRQPDRLPVAIKTSVSEYPAIAEVAKLKYEYEVVSSLKSEGIVRFYSLETDRNRVALIEEDFGGRSLDFFLSYQPLKLLDCLKIIFRVARTLHDVHQNNIIHKDIKPQNILFAPQTGIVKLADFGIASRLSRENAVLTDPYMFEGTLAYMSPEQTGRMNRSIDYRTDFYSLGVTFYQILTGKLPFDSTDPMELIHCHIAKIPTLPHQLAPNIPPLVSKIVMKLLSKTAEERYQSAWGLSADLQLCIDTLDREGRIVPFTIGRQDRASKLQIPQKLYGREAEVGRAIAAFDRVSSGTTELAIVSGYSGVGKSALVNEIHKPIVEKRGYFTFGKFEQFKRNIPYSAWVQCLSESIRQILTESKPKIEVWKRKILYAVGDCGRILIDVVPEIELIIGAQPSLPTLSASESQTCFNRVFKNFLQVFADRQSPLVIFLDDVQWADSASLKLIESLVSAPRIPYLMLVLAYRDNEVNSSHPLMLALGTIQHLGIKINEIHLNNLHLKHLKSMISDTLKLPKSQIKTLAEIVFEKTHGNPFFVNQVLEYLDRNHSLYFDLDIGSWQWDEEKLQQVKISDNVVELNIEKLKKLSLETQNILMLASCIGNQFDLKMLSIVNQRTMSETADELWEALQAGTILPLNNNYKMLMVLDPEEEPLESSLFSISYKFFHDRVQQAASSLISPEIQQDIRLKIGRLLLSKTPPDNLEEKIFEIVNQLNATAGLHTTAEEKLELARLNAIAARKAKAAAAYEPALNYLNVGLSALPEKSWQTHYDLTFELYLNAIEVKFLNGNFEEADARSNVALKKARTALDRAKIYELKVTFYGVRQQMCQAIEMGLQATQMLGFEEFPDATSDLPNLEWLSCEDFNALPPLNDERGLLAMELLAEASVSAYLVDGQTLERVTLAQLRLSRTHGYSPHTAVAYIWYGAIACGMRDDWQTAACCAKRALKLVEGDRTQALRCSVDTVLAANIAPWREEIRASLPRLLDAIQIGRETRNFAGVGHGAIEYCHALFWAGDSLSAIESQQAKILSLLRDLKLDSALASAGVWGQLTLNLAADCDDATADPLMLVGGEYDETAMVPQLYRTKNRAALCCAYVAKTILGTIFNTPDRALENAKRAAEQTDAMVGSTIVATRNFYESLALLGCCTQLEDPRLRSQYLVRVENNQQRMKTWARSAPKNYQHCYELVEAETARVLDRPLKAMEYYDLAIESAAERGYLRECALANELAARFYFSLGRNKVGNLYLKEARQSYALWGARRKVAALAREYPQLGRSWHDDTQPMTVSGSAQSDSPRIVSTFRGHQIDTLDFATAMKSTQALSSEILLDSLLDKLIKIVLENAGAQLGFLMLLEDDRLTIEVAGSVELDRVVVRYSLPVEKTDQLPLSIVNYVARTQQSIVLNDAASDSNFVTDPYIQEYQPKSVLCAPIQSQGKLIGLVYLENNLVSGAFTPDRLKVLTLLCAQAAISLENATLYQNLQESETREREKNSELQRSLEELQQAQLQLVQSEKMSALGQLIAGVAHEINNPASFIAGNITLAANYLEDLSGHLERYRQTFPEPGGEIEDHAEDIDLDYLIEDAPKLIDSMKLGTDRIRQISQSLRTFSRADTDAKVAVDIHEGIKSTLLILKHRLKANDKRPAIEVVEAYAQLPPIECFAGQLNQVFMNILANAIDALEETNEGRDYQEVAAQPNRITIATETNSDKTRAIVRIRDNGAGMKPEVRQKVFDRLFTTKPVGQGTGLGLSISHQIVTQKHGGKLTCDSTLGEGTEFTIELPM
ncbi:MAG: AAA family ATPase [Cyanobacteriota bacterium]|nr:AAA family ATPase [Cyanobacteriota bacterium]